MIVEGALCSKASCVVLVEASRVPREADEAAGRTAAEAFSEAPEGCKNWRVPQLSGAAVSGSMDERPAAPRPDRLALRLIRCRQLRVILKNWAGLPSVSLTLAGQRRNRRNRAYGE